MKKFLIVLFTVILTLAFTMPAMAVLHWESVKGQQVSMDAYVILGTWWVNTDNPSGTDDDSDLSWFNYSDSRATVTFKSGKLSGTYQIGFKNKFDDPAGGFVKTRLIEATYTVNDDMSISIGKMYAPWYFWCNSRSAEDTACAAHGGAWDWFDPAFVIRYKGAFLEFADPIAKTYSLTSADTDVTIPRVYVGYDYSSEGLFVGGAVGYNTFKIKGMSGATTIDETVNAWQVHLHADVKLTDMFSIRTAGHYGTNPDELHYMAMPKGGVVDGDDIKDTTVLAGFAELNAKFGDNTARIGYGYRQYDNDASTWTEKDKSQTYYALVEIPIHRESTGATFLIYPEIAVFDEMEDETGAEEATTTYAGIVWQINF